MIARRMLLLWTAAGILVVAGGGVIAWRLYSYQTLTAITSDLPTTPDLTRWPAELRERVARGEEQTRRQRDNIDAWSELSRLYHANGFLREAGWCYEALLALDPRNSRWPHRHGALLAGFGELPRALPLLRRAVALDPSYLAAAIRLGDALFKDGELAEAARVYDSVLRRDAGNPFALAGLARLDINAGNWQQARDRLKRLSASTPYGTALDLLVTAYDQLRQPDDAMRVRARLAQTRVYRDLPDPWMDELAADCFDPYLLSVAAAAAESFGDLATAIRWLERAIAFAPGDPSLHRHLGQILVARRDYTRARQHLEKAVELAPTEPDNWVQLLLLMSTVGDAGAANRALADGLAACPDSPALHLEKGRLLKAKGEYANALAALAESSRLRPYEADAFIESAHIYFRLNQTEPGVVQLRHALAAVPGHPVATYFLARYAISVGDEATAVQLIRQARLQPKFLPQELDALSTGFRDRFGKLP